MSLRLAATAAVAVLAVLPAPLPAGAAVFNPETFTLDNGLQVIVVTNRSAPVVAQHLYYLAGSADETHGHSGIAHFLEHLMFRGTATVPDGEFSRIIAREGGDDNAFTTWDYTGYWQEVARDRLPLVMELEADRMANLRLDAAKVRTENAVIIEERRQRIDDDPAARLTEQMSAALYQNHPYGIPIIGWEHEMAALTLEDAQAWYETWYVPNNAVLLLVGDIDAAEARPLVEQYYGPIPSRPVPERVRPQEPARQAERVIVLSDPGVQQPSWRRYYRAPSSTRDPDGHAYALQVLDEILGAGSTSRLYRSLVIDQGLAVAAGSGYSSTSIDETIFAFFGVPAEGGSLDEVEAAIDAEIAKLLKDGVTEAEVTTAKDRLVIQAAYALDSLSAPARTLGSAVASGLGVDDVEAWPDRIAAVTAEQVMAAARAVLERENSVSGRLLPQESQP